MSSKEQFEVHHQSLEVAHEPTAEKTVEPESESGEPASHAHSSKDWWLWEVVGVIGSAVALAGIIILVAVLDGKPLPSWSQKHSACESLMDRELCGSVTVSVNSVIAWMSTIGKLCVLIPISRGLGQLKWVWFAEGERSLADLDKFDAAAGGLTGSLSLLWRLKGRHFAGLGALAIILSLGFDPFIQNLVTYEIQYPKVSNQGSAFVGNITKYNSQSDSVHVGTDISMEAKANIMASLYNQNSEWSVPKYTCPTGDCSWDSFESLGICSFCEDLTDSLHVDCKDRQHCDAHLFNTYLHDVNFPTTFSLQTKDSIVNVMNINVNGVPVLEKFLTSLQQPHLIVDSITAFNPDGLNNNTKFVASECWIGACVRHYDKVTVKSQSGDGSKPGTGRSYTEQSSILTTPHDVKRSKRGDVSIQASGKSWQVEYNSLNSIMGYLGYLLDGHAMFLDKNSFDYRTGSNDPPEDGPQPPTTDMMQAIFHGNYEDCKTPDNGNICAMENLALGITQVMRNQAWTQDGATLAKGAVRAPVTYVQVTWIWIILPVLLWVLGLVMLIGTVWKTRRAGLWAWRLNPLAIIFLGFDAKAMENINHDHGMSEDGLARKAEALKVRLRVNHREAVMEGS